MMLLLFFTGFTRPPCSSIVVLVVHIRSDRISLASHLHVLKLRAKVLHRTVSMDMAVHLEGVDVY